MFLKFHIKNITTIIARGLLVYIIINRITYLKSKNGVSDSRSDTAVFLKKLRVMEGLDLPKL